jgi:hypothetical protein
MFGEESPIAHTMFLQHLSLADEMTVMSVQALACVVINELPLLANCLIAGLFSRGLQRDKAIGGLMPGVCLHSRGLIALPDPLKCAECLADGVGEVVLGLDDFLVRGMIHVLV